MSDQHSRNSASNFEADSLCPGRRSMQKGKPDESSIYADEGTAAHTLLDWCLKQGKDAAAFRGRKIAVPARPKPREFEVDDEMIEAVQTALDNIRETAGEGLLLSEERVYYSDALGVPRSDAWGTADVIVLSGNEVQVHDYKHGRGVAVDAVENSQMRLYALGALDAVDAVLGPFERVRMFIHQPRIKEAPSEYAESAAELREWGFGPARRLREQIDGAEQMRLVLSQREWEPIYLRPNDKSCKFCRAKATCPALRKRIEKAVAMAKEAPDVGAADDFEVLV